jgi:betaine-aldehyde dehydrogenase
MSASAADVARESLGALPDACPALFVGGHWQAPSETRSTPSFDPSSGELLADVPVAQSADVDAAVRAAAEAQREWEALGLAGRAEHLHALRDLIVSEAEPLAQLDALNGGLPIDSARADVEAILQEYRDWPGLALALRGETVPFETRRLHYTRQVAYGVVARIVPFNHPIYFAACGVLAPLLAGNAVVLKVADQTPLSALLFADLARRALPPGVLSVLTGDAATGEALVTHPLVRRIAFTGSTPTGLAIQRSAAADHVRTVTLELGGKNPMIVFPDADLDAAVDGAVAGSAIASATQGQSCGSVTRLFVHADINDQFVERLAARLGELRVGPAYAEDTEVGPLVSARQQERVRGYIESGLDEGARLVTGGDTDGDWPDGGYFVAPTLFAGVRMDMRIAREEIFGPVSSVLSWTSWDEVVAAANSVDYGLTASVWTSDLSAALRTVDALESGYVWVNDVAAHYWGTPFGGFKDSGLGREECLSELASFLQPKAVHVSLGDLPGVAG